LHYLLLYGILLLLLASFILFTAPIIISNLADIIINSHYMLKNPKFSYWNCNSLKTVDPNTLKEVGDKFMAAMPK